jgi:hypothetical protein
MDYVSIAPKNSPEAIVAYAFSTLMLLMMPKIRHELQLEDEMCLKGRSSVVALVV